MFLAGSPARWLAPKPYLQGLGAKPRDDGFTVEVLFVNGESRSRFVNVRVFLYANDTPSIVSVVNPRLAPGVHEQVVLHGKH